MSSSAGPRILARPQHAVSRQHFDTNALKVLYRLHNAGFKAFLVGGAVRDLMVGRQPKDFDIGTDARPQQIRRLFRNSRIIGRRFRLAHVYFRQGIIEVSTFRRDPDPEAQESAPGDHLITDDNVFGTPEEDAFRRDFTVNALIYDIADFSVVDYVGGIEDLEERLIRAIGTPEIRFQEDPVRMLRACELAGRLGFIIETGTAKAAHEFRSEISKASPARITEEILQLLRCGSAAPALEQMQELGLLPIVLPEAQALVGAAETDPMSFAGVIPALDNLVNEGRELSDAALLGALLLPSVLLRRRDLEDRLGRPLRRGQLKKVTIEVLEPFESRLCISRAKSDQLFQAVWAFHRLGERWRSAADRLHFATQPGCDDALALLEMLVEATGEGKEEFEIWKRIRRRRPSPKERPVKRRRPRRRRRR